MAVSLKHTTQAAGTNAGNGEIGKSQWNEEHTLTAGANKLLGTITAGSVGEIDCTAAGRALLDDADAAAQRTTLGVGTGDSPQFTAVNVGNASDATLARAAAGTLSVEGKSIPYVFAQSGAAVSVGAVTTETVLATITIPAGAMGPNGWISLDTSWTMISSANSKTTFVRVGGAAGTAFLNVASTTIIGARRQVIVINNNSQTAQKTGAAVGNTNGVGYFAVAGATASVDTSAAWDLVISGQKAVAGDTLTLEGYQAIIYYGA